MFTPDPKLEPLESRLLMAGTISEQIIVDQFGWRSDAPRKVAIFADPVSGQNSTVGYIPGGTFQIRRVSDDAVAFTGATTVWNGGATDWESGDKTWEGDFSSFTTPGEYYIYDPANNSRSYTFRLDNAIFNDILKATDRMYYYQRTGTAIPAQYGGNWHHAIDHVGPGQDTQARLMLNGSPVPGTERDVSGGWFDAGDYNKYVPFTTSVIFNLLSGYEYNSGAFSDTTNIPESGNGVPDLLDEVKWELDWMRKMQLPNGSVLNRVSNWSYDAGNADPATDTQARFYTSATTWATAAFAAAAAHASRVYAAFDALYPGYSQTLRAAAENAWVYLQAKSTMFPTDGTDGSGWLASAPASADSNADNRVRLFAAAELYKTTGGATYKTYFETNYKNPNTFEGDFHPLVGAYTRFDPAWAMDLNRGFITYATTPGANSSIVGEIQSSLRHMADDIVLGNYYSHADPYRAFMWDGHYGWGSNQTKAEWANLLLHAIRLNVNPSNNGQYRELAEEYVHYFHGRNPLSYVYLSNMGSKGANLGADKSPMQYFHSWFPDGSALYDGPDSTYGPAPGFVVGGPNKYFGISWITPPYGEPAMKAFKDWNTVWNPQHNTNENSWEITEPAIYSQAAYAMLLAQFATDAYPPRVLKGEFSIEDGETVKISFNESVAASIAPGDLILQNLTTGATVPSSKLTVSYDSATNVASFDYSAGRLPDGNYRATLSAGAVSDSAGNALTASYSTDFFALAGDANRDRVVDISDLGILATNWQGSPRNFSQGDFNNDGQVDISDLGILATNWQKSVAAPSAPADELMPTVSIMPKNETIRVSARLSNRMIDLIDSPEAVLN